MRKIQKLLPQQYLLLQKDKYDNVMRLSEGMNSTDNQALARELYNQMVVDYLAMIMASMDSDHCLKLGKAVTLAQYRDF